MKRRAWKWLLAIVGGMALIMAAILGDAYRRASATLESHRKDVTRKIELARSRPATRPPLGQDPVDENAWGLYVQVFEQVKALPKDVTEALPELDAELEFGDLPDDHLLHGLFASCGVRIELLERAARCRFVDPDFHFEAGQEMPLRWTGDSIRTARFLSGLISHHHRTGREGESLRLAALGLAMAQDVGRRGPVIASLIQWANESIFLDALKWIFLEGHGFSREDLEQFARQLEDLDRHRPTLADAWEAEDACTRQSLVHSDWEKFWGGMAREPVVPGWRCLYSRRITRAQALNEWSRLLERFRRLTLLPASPQRIAQLEALSVEIEGHANPMLRFVTSSHVRICQRDSVAALGRTLLRLSVAVARYQLDRGGDPDNLEALVPRYLSAIPSCPLTGEPFRCRDGRVWSIGIDRVDDGGVEGEYGGLEDGGDADAVWTVRRR